MDENKVAVFLCPAQVGRAWERLLTQLQVMMIKIMIKMVIMLMLINQLWYKYYSGGWCTWPTPLKYAESKFKYTEA